MRAVCVLFACVRVSSMFIIDIADKLLGSDWTCLMSCWCESQRMKMGFCICTTAQTPDRWRQMGGVSCCLVKHSQTLTCFFQHRKHTHSSLSPSNSVCCLKIAIFFFCHPASWGQDSVLQQPIAIHRCDLHTHTPQIAVLWRNCSVQIAGWSFWQPE